jgi:hypothetical protein
MNRKDLLREYKETPRPMGVLVVRVKASGEAWLEAGLNLPALENRQRFQLELGQHASPAVQAAWNEAGEGALTFEVAARLEPREGADDREYRADLEVLLDLVRSGNQH